MGFDEVYDTSLSADLTVIEESNEFLERLENGGKLPLITSCCPGWVKYCENKHPELLDNVSSCKSPMQMLAALLKDRAKQNGEKTFHVAIMPCTAKKSEATRDEFTTDGTPDVDAVITTNGLIRMIKESGIDFESLEPEAVDMPFGTISGAGVIFGVTGGVTEAVLRRVAATKTRASLLSVANQGQRGMEGVKEFDLEYGDKTLHIAVVSGLANAERVIKRVQAGEHFDFIEVMACPGGCINGAGQPYVMQEGRKERAKGLYEADRLLSVRTSDENPLITAIYNDIIKDRAHELLHVHYGK